MSGALILHRTGPGLTVQDMGRPGLARLGLSRGGAADRQALLEATALLCLRAPVAALEMPALGGSFEVTQPTRIALTGAPMRADLDGSALRWSASHLILPGQRLTIGAATSGVYGYLTPAGGILGPEWQGSRAAHLVAGIGATLAAGDRLPLGADPAPDAPGQFLPVEDRFTGGLLRWIDGPQTDLFPEATRARFAATAFRRAPTGNRQGIRLDCDGPAFAADLPKTGLASEFILPGDIQMTGDGRPYILLSECQTIGGYPRIGTVLPADLPRAAQSAPGAVLRFQRVTLAEADALARPRAARLASLRAACHPLRRDPRDMPDLLSYQLISGVTAGDDLDPPTPLPDLA